MEMKYYSLKQILKKNAQYNIIIGERSNGKTYACLLHCLKEYICNGNQFAIVRRWKEDVRGKRAGTIFNSICANNEISELTNEQFNNVYYQNGCWYLMKVDIELKKPVLDSKPFAYGFALTDMEHDKSTSYPNITNIIFDEFITRSAYIPDEFMLFMNVISTIVRHRDNVKIFMLGNTVNKYSPYFNEFGLTNIQSQKQGTIDLYKYGNSKLKVAVEYCDNINKSKPSDIYFAFNNPKLNMVTNGVWEMDIYPHLPYKYKPKDILFYFFVIFGNDILQCEIINVNDDSFIYVHRKTTPIKKDTDLVYSLNASSNIYTFKYIDKPLHRIQKKIVYYFQANKIFYQNNEVGEILRNYINASKA